VVFSQVIGERVVVVVGEFPTIVRENQWHHTDSSNNLVNDPVSCERLMGTVVADNEQASGSCTTEHPRQGLQIPRGKVQTIRGNGQCDPHTKHGKKTRIQRLAEVHL